MSDIEPTQTHSHAQAIPVAVTDAQRPDATAGSGKAKFMRKIFKLLNHNWIITVFGGLILAFLTPLVTGFANLTFSTKSWETFGVSNEAGTPGSYIAPDAVYSLPLGERFRVDGDFLLSVYWYQGWPYAALTGADGITETNNISVARSMYKESECERVAVHLMRRASESDLTYFIMYNSERLDKEECKGFLSSIFG